MNAAMDYGARLCHNDMHEIAMLSAFREAELYLLECNKHVFSVGHDIMISCHCHTAVKYGLV